MTTTHQNVLGLFGLGFLAFLAIVLAFPSSAAGHNGGRAGYCGCVEARTFWRGPEHPNHPPAENPTDDMPSCYEPPACETQTLTLTETATMTETTIVTTTLTEVVCEYSRVEQPPHFGWLLRPDFLKSLQ